MPTWIFAQPGTGLWAPGGQQPQAAWAEMHPQGAGSFFQVGLPLRRLDSGPALPLPSSGYLRPPAEQPYPKPSCRTLWMGPRNRRWAEEYGVLVLLCTIPMVVNSCALAQGCPQVQGAAAGKVSDLDPLALYPSFQAPWDHGSPPQPGRLPEAVQSWGWAAGRTPGGLTPLPVHPLPSALCLTLHTCTQQILSKC